MNKFYKTLKSQGITCTKNSLYAYLDHLADAFLLFQTPLHSRSEKARRVNPKKIYVIDHGLLKAMSLRITADRGALLENLVFMHLRGQGRAPEYYTNRTGAEVDFLLAPEDEDTRRLIQVCWDLSNPATKTRKATGLSRAMDELGVEHGTIVSWVHEETLDNGIEIVPAWRWFLGSFATRHPA